MVYQYQGFVVVYQPHCGVVVCTSHRKAVVLHACSLQEGRGTPHTGGPESPAAPRVSLVCWSMTWFHRTAMGDMCWGCLNCLLLVACRSAAQQQPEAAAANQCSGPHLCSYGLHSRVHLAAGKPPHHRHLLRRMWLGSVQPAHVVAVDYSCGVACGTAPPAPLRVYVLEQVRYVQERATNPS